MSKKLESFKEVLTRIESRSHMSRERLNCGGASDEEKIRISLMYDAKKDGVIEAAAFMLNAKEYDILYDFAGKLELV